MLQWCRVELQPLPLSVNAWILFQRRPCSGIDQDNATPAIWNCSAQFCCMKPHFWVISVKDVELRKHQHVQRASMGKLPKLSCAYQRLSVAYFSRSGIKLVDRICTRTLITVAKAEITASERGSQFSTSWFTELSIFSSDRIRIVSPTRASIAVSPLLICANWFASNKLPNPKKGFHSILFTA